MADKNEKLSNPEGLAKMLPKTTEEYLNQFVFVIYRVNCLRDHVRVVLDDGSIRLFMKREKFLDMMTKLLNESLSREYYNTTFLIKKSLTIEGGIFYYDKVHNKFDQLSENVDFDHIKPQELIQKGREQIRGNAVIEQINYKHVAKDYDNTVDSKFSFQTIKKSVNRMFGVIRGKGSDFTNKKKPLI